jgi:uncharacterized membrane protein YgcG
MAGLESRIDALEKPYEVGTAVVFVHSNDGETKEQAEKKYEKEHKVKLEECNEVIYLIDNIKD